MPSTYAGSELNCFITETAVINPSDPDTNSLSNCLGPLVSVTSNGTNYPFLVLISTPQEELYKIELFIPADEFSIAYTTIYTNATNVNVLTVPPEFIVQPEDQSLFTGETASFAAFAIHTSGWVWQKDGASLVENGHFLGVTNATLTINNVQPSDAGVYSAVASQPGGTDVSSAGASLAVFKPLLLSLEPLPDAGGYLCLATNQDGTAFDPARLPNLGLYTTTDLSQPFSSWDLATNAFVCTNGVAETTLPNDRAAARFWRVMESP